MIGISLKTIPLLKLSCLRVRSIAIILLLFNFYLEQGFSQSALKYGNMKIKIPTGWIEKLAQYDYKHNKEGLLQQFEGYIKPYTLDRSASLDYPGDWVLNPMFVNLDNDSENEIIGLFGWSQEHPALAVFKKIGQSWFLIYLEPFFMKYQPPELQVANNFSTNKTFYIRWLYDGGSGIYRDAYHFYKIINNRVYPCLELINEARIDGWGLYLNQEVKMKLEFNSANGDNLWVEYDFNFFPGAVYSDDVPWSVHQNISFVKGESKGVSYNWDTLTNTYQPYIYAFDTLEGLTKDKIACFGAFGNDTLFVKAFRYEIGQTLKKGSDEQKIQLQKYLDLVKSKKKAVSPKGGLEEKTQQGGTKFYGTKQNK